MAAYECVERKRFAARLVEMIEKAQKVRAKLLVRIRSNDSAFKDSVSTIIELNVWIDILDTVSKANEKPKTTVESIQTFAIGEVLRKAESPHADKNELRAWALIVDLTQPGSMQTSR